jgi:hypothetical protein
MATKSTESVSVSEDKKEVIRHKTNPFVEGMVVPIRDKQVRMSRMGKAENVNVVNSETGEHMGTHVTAFKKVDAAQFVKLFTQNIALTFDLKSAGIKALTVVMWVMQSRGIQRDLVPLDKLVLDDFVESHGDRKPPLRLSQPTFWRGLAELEKAKIIAKHLRPGWYYINPNFAFNGDRVAFTTVIERQSDSEERQNELDLES